MVRNEKYQTQTSSLAVQQKKSGNVNKKAPIRLKEISNSKACFRSQKDQFVPCFKQRSVKDESKITLTAAPINLRMAIKVNKVQQLKQSTKTLDSLPPLSIPVLNEWPLDAKIPDYRRQAWPEGSLYFSRGKIGRSLNHSKTEFDLTDPKGYKQPLGLADYTALHDPHAKRYFKFKGVVPVLQQNELINSEKEVLCNPKEYNKFRKHLSSIQSEGVQLKLRKNDLVHKFSMAIQKPFNQYQEVLKNGETHSDRLHKVRMKNLEQLHDKSARAEKGVKKWERQLQWIEQEKRRQRLISIQQQPNNEYVRKYRQYMKAVDDFEARKRLLGKSIFDVKRAAYNSKYDKLITRVLTEREEIDKLITLKKRDEQLMELKNLMDESTKVAKKTWIKRYEKHIQYSQHYQKEIVAAQKAKAQRELFLQRKYYDLWREFVINARDPNSSHNHHLHESAFKVERELKNTVDYFIEISGFDPRQDALGNLFINLGTLIQNARASRKPEIDDDENFENPDE